MTKALVKPEVSRTVTSERAQFAGRLIQCMGKAAMLHSPTGLARSFNRVTKGEFITSHAARKWLMGEALPAQPKIQELAAMFGCEAQWLRFGEREANFTAPRLHPFDAVLQQRFALLTDLEQQAVRDLLVAMTKGRT